MFDKIIKLNFCFYFDNYSFKLIKAQLCFSVAAAVVVIANAAAAAAATAAAAAAASAAPTVTSYLLMVKQMNYSIFNNRLCCLQAANSGVSFGNQLLQH